MLITFKLHTQARTSLINFILKLMVTANRFEYNIFERVVNKYVVTVITTLEILKIIH